MSKHEYPQIFEAGEDFEMNACLNFFHDSSFGYIEGYRRAADHLVQHVAETGRDLDVFVYPIAFMYRQHIELLLKKIIADGGELLTDKGGHPTHHKLHDLWPLAKGILRQVWVNEPDPSEFELINNFIDQFARIDHDSTAFRYPFQKGGAISLSGMCHINLRNLAECVDSFSGFLDGAASALAEYVQRKRDCESDMRNY